ncbi:ribonuclease 3 [Alphaproteobacteria bacterium]|nr:ribonuclease 3 [Alphaproteobacteria bacterium]GHS99715.1 ribonuclease 3 [Alphaproteobacteria bacterium]
MNPYVLSIQKELHYIFKNVSLLEEALRHSSLIPARSSCPKKQEKSKTQEKSERSFDRLEFLGDRVLNLCVAQYLYLQFPGESEGALSQRHSALVRFESCAKVAENIGLDRALEVATGTSFQDLRILCDALEALLGALYLDGGLAPCQAFIEKHWKNRTHVQAPPQEPKNALQEWAQERWKTLPVYTVLAKGGSEHMPTYKVSVVVANGESAFGEGPSKKAAEKEAAANFLKRLKSPYISNSYKDNVIKFLILSSHGGVATIPWDF